MQDPFEPRHCKSCSATVFRIISTRHANGKMLHSTQCALCGSSETVSGLPPETGAREAASVYDLSKQIDAETRKDPLLFLHAVLEMLDNSCQESKARAAEFTRGRRQGDRAGADQPDGSEIATDGSRSMDAGQVDQADRDGFARLGIRWD